MTKDDIFVPETLLKKRKSQEKDREAKAAENEKRKKVQCPPASTTFLWTLKTMISSTIRSTRLLSMLS